MEFEQPTEEKTRAEELLASRLRSSQFRLTTALGAMLLVGFLMAIPRFAGVDYQWYFLFLYMLLYACAPFVAWLTFVVLPKRFGSARFIAASLVLLALVLPIWTLIAQDEGLWELTLGITMTCIIFWLPQSLCLWMVWFLVFRAPTKRR